jgi:hypothetical protein
MNYRRMLLGSTVLRAPENDQGAEFDDVDEGGADDPGEDDQDDEFDDPDEDQDEEPDEPEEGDDPPRRKPNRAQDRIASLTAREKAEKERADRLEAELRQIRQGPQKSPEELAREEAAHLATMTAEQRLQYQIEKNDRQTQHRLNQIQFATADATDKATFDGLCARNPAVAALKGEVETALGRIRAGGGNVSREVVAKYVLGDMAMAKATRANNAGSKRAAAGRERQAVR